MKLDVIFSNLIVRGEFEGQAFEADYSSDDGWHAGNGIQCLNEKFVDSDEYDDWHERFEKWLFEHGYEAVFGQR